MFIKEKTNNLHNGIKCSNMKNKDQKLSSKVEKELQKSEQNVKSSRKTDKPVDSLVTFKNSEDSALKRSKQTALPSSNTEAAMNRSEVKPTESVSKAAEQPSQVSECSKKNQCPPNSGNSSIQKTYISEISAKESVDRCHGEQQSAQKITQERPSVIQNSLNLANSSSHSEPIHDNTLLAELVMILRTQKSGFASLVSLVEKLGKIINDNTKAMNDVKQLFASNRTSSIDTLTPSPSTSTTAENEKISEKKNNKRKQQDDQNGSSEENDDDGGLKKRRCQKRNFILPPEYDENDSRWTLKYQELAPGLVELMPHTNVYINAIKLSNCKRLSKDCKSLARMLLVEIFTKSALTVCSLTGSRAKAYDVEGTIIRPGLDENARTVLLTYVEEYGRERGWSTVETQSIQNSIRNKMQEFRLKYE